MWCNPPASNPVPFIKHTLAQVRAIPGAVAAIMVQDCPGSTAHTLVKHLPHIIRYPAGSRLFVQPSETAPYINVPVTTPTRHAYKVYVAHSSHDAKFAEAVSRPQGNAPPPHPYIFQGRLHAPECTSRVRVRTNAPYRVIESSPQKAASVNVLGDSGATHSLIPLSVVQQLGIPLSSGPTGRKVILGDNSSGLEVLGTCDLQLTFGSVTTKVSALVLPVDWGSAQHIVLGADWIAENSVMLGAPNSRGPQMHIGCTPGSRPAATVFARKHTPLPEGPGDPDTPMSASQFAEMLAEPYEGEHGTPWIAVDITHEGVCLPGKRKIPFSETVHTIHLLPNAKPVFRRQWRISPREDEASQV